MKKNPRPSQYLYLVVPLLLYLVSKIAIKSGVRTPLVNNISLKFISTCNKQSRLYDAHLMFHVISTYVYETKTTKRYPGEMKLDEVLFYHLKDQVLLASTDKVL